MENNEYQIYIAWNLPVGSRGAYCTCSIWTFIRLDKIAWWYNDMEMIFFPHYWHFMLEITCGPFY